jgi:hypothetical protein
MYDVKEEAKKTEHSNNTKLKYDCVCDRMYFEMSKNTSMVKIKKNIIPIEGIFS